MREPQGGVSVNPEAVADLRDRRIPAAARGALDGLMFGFGDTLAGIGGAIDPNNTYATARDEWRQATGVDRRDAPGSRLAGQMAGGAVISALLAGPFDDALRAVPGLGGSGVVPRMGRSAIQGGSEGALFGAGEADGEDVIPSMMTGAAGGMAIGAAIPPTAEILRRMILRPAGAVLNVGNQSRAANRVIRAMEEAGMSPDQIDDALMQAAQDGQDIFNVADVLGRSGRSALAGTTTQPGAARALAEESLDGRAANSTRRLREFVNEAFNANDATAAQQRATQITSRADDARVNYDAARGSAGPVNLNAAVESIDNLLGTNPLLGETSDLAQSSLGRRLQGFRNRMNTDANQLIDFDEVVQLRTDLRLWREQNPRAAAVTNDLYDALTEALSDASSDFRAANDAYRQASRLIEAGDAGRQASGNVRFADALDRANAMHTPEERDAFRLAFADRDLRRIEGATGDRNMARTVFGGESPSMDTTELAYGLANDPDLFLRRIGREDVMAQTRNRALSGSTTAENLAEQGAAAAEDLSIMGNLFSGRPVAAAGQLAGRTVATAQGQNEATREIIARALLSRDPGDLQRLLATQQGNDAVSQIIAGLIRGGVRAPAYEAGMSLAR